jgi:hypothetical protein
MTTIRYFIPEDGDEEMHPNVFLAPKAAQPGYPPLLGQVKDSFPLEGSYHFRFKAPLVPGGDREGSGSGSGSGSNMSVWMDCVDDSQPVRVWKNAILAKVTRIHVHDNSQHHDNNNNNNNNMMMGDMHLNDDLEDSDDDPDFRGRGVSMTNPPISTNSAPPPRPSPPPTDHSLLGVFGEAPAPAAAPSSRHSSRPSSTHSSQGDLLDVDPPSSMGRGGGHHDDLLGMSSTPASSHGRPTTSHHHNEFMGLSSAAAAPAPNSYHATPQSSYAPRPTASVPPPLNHSSSNVSNSSASGVNNNNAFDSFGQSQGPFGGLGTPWK